MKKQLDKPICRRPIPTKIDEEQFPELFRDFYKEYRDTTDKILDDLKEIHSWMERKDRAGHWIRKGVRSILEEGWQKIVTAIVAALFTWGAIKFLGL